MRWIVVGNRLILTAAEIPLSPIQQRIGEQLVRRNGELASHDEIIDAMYRGVPEADQPEDYDGMLKVEIHHIRGRIDDAGPSGRAALQNVHGYGYKLVVPK